MKPAKKHVEPTPSTESTAAHVNSSAVRWMRWGVGLIVSIHLLIMLSLMVNHVSHPEIVAGSDAWHMLYFHQFSEGGHSYYPKNDIQHVTDGYTPLASEIFGWTIKVFGTDIRWTRGVACLFGLGAIWLAGMCVLRLTQDRFFAFVAMGLSSAVEVKWYMDVGPNTVHVFFSILAVYLFLRDPGLSWKTLVAAGLALFASFWSKQLGLAYMVAGTVYVLSQNWRKGLWLGGGLAALSVVAITYYANLENSEFIYWVFKMNQQQMMIWSRLWTVVYTEILTRKFAIVGVFTVAGVMAYERSWRGLFRPELLMLGAAAVIGPYTNGKYGSGTSQMYVFYVLLVVMGVSYAYRFFRDRRIAVPLLGAMLGMQGLALAEDVRPYYINDEDAARYQQLFSILKTPGKSSYFINRGFLSLLAGQPAYPQAGEDSWVNGRFDPTSLSAERRAYLASDPWDLVIIDIPTEDNSYALYDRLEKAYKPLYEMPPSTRFPQAYDLRYKKIIFEKKKAPVGPVQRR